MMMTHAPYKVFVDVPLSRTCSVSVKTQSTICIEIQYGCVACTGSGPPDLAILQQADAPAAKLVSGA